MCRTVVLRDRLQEPVEQARARIIRAGQMQIGNEVSARHGWEFTNLHPSGLRSPIVD